MNRRQSAKQRAEKEAAVARLNAHSDARNRMAERDAALGKLHTTVDDASEPNHPTRLFSRDAGGPAAVSPPHAHRPFRRTARGEGPRALRSRRSTTGGAWPCLNGPGARAIHIHLYRRRS